MLDFLSDPRWVVLLVLGLGSLVFFLGRWVRHVNSNLRKFREFMDEMREDIKKILSRLPVYLVSQDGPLRLNELGEEMASKLGLAKWARANAKRHSIAVQNLKPFEIQDYCYELLNNRFSPTPDQETAIRESEYENGLKRDQNIEVFVIVLRDHLIQESVRQLDLRTCMSSV